MFQRWPKRDPNKHYYLVPNEVFNLGLSSHEIAVYNYLLRCEDRKTYQCHPSYRTIGRAVQLSENTVRKYVAGLEEKGLIRTEPSTVTTKDGRVRNGSLIYTIRPVQEAMELNYQRQFLQVERHEGSNHGDKDDQAKEAEIHLGKARIDPLKCSWLEYIILE